MEGDLGSLEAVEKREREIHEELSKGCTWEKACDLVEELGKLDEERQCITKTGFYKG